MNIYIYSIDTCIAFGVEFAISLIFFSPLKWFWQGVYPFLFFSPPFTFTFAFPSLVACFLWWEGEGDKKGRGKGGRGKRMGSWIGGWIVGFDRI